MPNHQKLIVILTIFVCSMNCAFCQTKKHDANYYFQQANIRYQVSPEHYSDSLAKSCLPLYTKAIQLNPRFWQAYRNRSRIYSDLKMYKNSIADINSALKYTNSDDAVYLLGMRGDNYYKNGDYKKAVKDFSKAIPKEGNPSYHFFMRAKAKWKLGLKEESCKDYQIAIKDDPNLVKEKEFLECN